MDILKCEDAVLLRRMYRVAKDELEKKRGSNSEMKSYLKEQMNDIKRRLRRLGEWEEPALSSRPFGKLKRARKRKIGKNRQK